MRQGDLPVDEGIVETRGCGIDASSGEKNTIRARQKIAPAHGAWFAGGVQVAAGKLETAEHAAGFANRYHLGVRRGIVGAGHLVAASSNDGSKSCFTNSYPHLLYMEMLR